MAGMGPPPKHPDQRRRRNLGAQMTDLPSEGRKGRAPKWPLPDVADRAEAEKAMWRELWALPQAVAWEQMHCEREVAQYVRWKVWAELGSLDAAKEARQLSDRLGLTPLAMLRLRWQIVADEVAEQRSEKTSPAPRRLTAVDPGALAGS